MKKRALITAAFAGMALSSAEATIVINLQADYIRDFNGVAAPLNSLAFIVASTADANFGTILPGSSTAVGTLIDGSDDYIVGVIPNSAWADVGVIDFAKTFNVSTIPGWNAGDRLGLVWLPALGSGASTIPNGARYGFYSNPSAIDGTQSWVTPGETFTRNLGFYTSDAGIFGPPVPSANTPASSRAATVVGVPEPTSAFLVAVGAAGLMMRRRRQS